MAPELFEGLDKLIFDERNNLAAVENQKRPIRKRK